MNYLDQILESWLPNKSSRLIAGLSITLGAASYFLPDFLNTPSMRTPIHLTLLVRIATPLLIWLLGSLLVLLIVVQHSKAIKTEKQPKSATFPPIAKPTELPEEQTDILILLFNQGERLTFQIAQRLNMEKKEEIVKYHLRELSKNKLIKEITTAHAGPRGQSSWFINDKGKKYLIENKLIS